MREFLRSLPVFDDAPADFDPELIPPAPQELFVAWLRQAVDAGVAEPHAMTLSTVDTDSRPDARILILKDVDDAGWWFASSSASAKGGQLAVHPDAALTFYWQSVARQVRVRGSVRRATVEQTAEDFLARGVGGRAVALTGRQSEPLDRRATLIDAVKAAHARLEEDPSLVPPDAIAYVVEPESVEFWQAHESRQHVRLRYQRESDGWSRTLLWP